MTGDPYLGNLTFESHIFIAPAGGTLTALEIKQLSAAKSWSIINEENQPTQSMIAALKTLCLDLSANGWTLLPDPLFKQSLRDHERSPAATYPAATVSPPEKRHY